MLKLIVAFLVALPVVVAAQGGGIGSDHFPACTTAWCMYFDRTLYALYGLFLGMGIMAAIIKWGVKIIAPNLDEAEALIARAADPEKEVTIGDGLAVVGIILSTTGRIAIIYWAILTFATRL